VQLKTILKRDFPDIQKSFICRNFCQMMTHLLLRIFDIIAEFIQKIRLPKIDGFIKIFRTTKMRSFENPKFLLNSAVQNIKTLFEGMISERKIKRTNFRSRVLQRMVRNVLIAQ